MRIQVPFGCRAKRRGKGKNVMRASENGCRRSHNVVIPFSCEQRWDKRIGKKKKLKEENR
jgi:hypothetical protein